MSKLNDVQAFEKEVLASEQPVLVDFYADWCGPCAIQTPILEAFAGEYWGSVAFKKLDVDKHSSQLARYGIRSIPSLFLFDKGKVVASHIGVGDKQVINRLVLRAA